MLRNINTYICEDGFIFWVFKDYSRYLWAICTRGLLQLEKFGLQKLCHILHKNRSATRNNCSCKKNQNLLHRKTFQFFGSASDAHFQTQRISNFPNLQLRSCPQNPKLIPSGEKLEIISWLKASKSTTSDVQYLVQNLCTSNNITWNTA